ncbi:hypothetical protein TGAM01_v201893 [Trichoderma gamsii]|uniref:Myb-like domain-containing protein n=1 Tax=Trichoderma gamsii TaxID=398673 RepID=A0A2P4ZZB4_9HYPO|nr:hypothetical protein TGAM01_v201893 [Trichoderma gamsii]PON29644.1 hypothetical protein TGAM01_v201893 [Trichoderma gamsii]
MQTRSKRAARAAVPLPTSPPQPTVRRNPPRGTGRRIKEAVFRARNADVGVDSGSDSNSDPDSDSESSSGPSSLLSSPTKSPSRILLPASSPASPDPYLVPSSSPGSATATAAAPQLAPSLPSLNPSPAPPPGRQIPKGLTTIPRKDSIIWDPIPRRGAPRNISFSSLFSTPKRDLTDDEDYEQTPSSPPKSAAELQAEKMAQREIEQTEVEMWLEATPALARDAKNVISLLRETSTRLAYKPVLQMKIKAFEMSRSIFTGPQPPSFRAGSPPETRIPFLNWDWVNKIEDEDMLDVAKKAVPLAVKMANIATALLHIRAIQEEAYDPVPFLEATDNLFPQSFAADESKHFLTLSLEIRTQRAIESIAKSPQGTELRGMLGFAFCVMNTKDGPNNYNALFAHGPYKPMAGLPKEQLLDVCSERVKDIWQLMSEGGERRIRTPVDLPSVRAKYPLPYTLELLKKWLFNRYASVSQLLEKAEQEHMAKEKQMLLEQWRSEEELRFREEHQARNEERRLREEDRRAREEENLRARQEALEKERKVWEREKLLRARQSDEGRSRERRGWDKQSPPPADEDSMFISDSPSASPWSLASSQGESQRSQIRRGEDDDPPREESLFQRGEVAGLLRNASLAGSSSDHARRKLPASKPSRTRPLQGSRRQTTNGDHGEEEGEEDQRRDDNDDDDEFETDQRPPKRSKTVNTQSASKPGPIQRRKEFKEAVATAVALGATAPPAPVLDFAEIERLKVQARVNAKLNNPRLLKKRQTWSERDSNTLIALVASRAAGWADMEKEDSHRFELPRNAQAYRDRARNMKVDFLISDAVLPRGFDLVTFSKKEIDRVQKLGKNPTRTEADVDRNGRPTNTAYVPPEVIEDDAEDAEDS